MSLPRTRTDGGGDPAGHMSITDKKTHHSCQIGPAGAIQVTAGSLLLNSGYQTLHPPGPPKETPHHRVQTPVPFTL